MNETTLTKKERKALENNFNVLINTLSKEQQTDVLKILYLLSNTSISDTSYNNYPTLKIDTDEISNDVLMHVLKMAQEYG